MDIHFPSIEGFQYLVTYDSLNASITALEATGIEQIILPEGYAWKWTLAVAVFLGLSLVVWRLWTFTVRPWMHPDEAREVPYWVPCHSMAFFRNSHGLITGAKTRTSNDEPYCLTMSGERYYILTTPQAAATTFRRTQALPWTPYLKRLMVQFGVRPSSLPSIWDPAGPESPRRNNPLNPKNRALVHHGEDMYRRQLNPGPNLDDFSYRLSELLNTSLQWHQLSKLCPSEKKIPLMDLCAHISIDAMTRSLFGDSLHEIEPRLTQTLYDFSEEAWKLLMFPYLKVAARRLHAARKGIYDALVTYMRTCSERRPEAAWFWQEILRKQEASELDKYDRAGITFMLTWAANINVYRLSHWVLCHVLCDPKLLNAVKAEIEPAFRNNDNTNTIDYHHIYDHCPRLTAVYKELLRLTFGSFSVRKISPSTSPVPVRMSGNKTLRPNSSVIVPICSLHYDTEAFGPDARSFNPTRFLDPKEALDKSPSFRPFAGGITYCPGRFLAKRQTLVFVAVLLWRYEIEVEGGERNDMGVKRRESGKGMEGGGGCRPPRIDQVGPSLGIMGPVRETELLVRLKEARR